LYKNHSFVEAGPALRVVAWILVPQVFSSVLGQVLVATHHEKITLKIAMVNGVLNLVVGWPLIRRYGLVGAASILVVTSVVGCILHYIPVTQLLSRISVLKIIWKPLVAAGCMGAYMALAITSVDILAGFSATLVYLAVLLVLAVWSSGGVRQFREKYLLTLPHKPASEN
jgi:O-antigen/teichoic acid export membrane protein